VQESKETPADSDDPEKNSFINYFIDDEHPNLWQYGIKVIYK
jgi:hypothetical protein